MATTVSGSFGLLHTLNNYHSGMIFFHNTAQELFIYLQNECLPKLQAYSTASQTTAIAYVVEHLH